MVSIGFFLHDNSLVEKNIAFELAWVPVAWFRSYVILTHVLNLSELQYLYV